MLVSILSSDVLFLEESNQENYCKDQAQRAYNDVAHSQEVVFATKGVCGWQNEALVTVEAIHIVIVLDHNLIVAWFNILGDFSVKFAEVGKTCGSHPHDEMLCITINKLYILPLVMSIHWTWSQFLATPLTSVPFAKFLNL